MITRNAESFSLNSISPFSRRAITEGSRSRLSARAWTKGLSRWYHVPAAANRPSITRKKDRQTHQGPCHQDQHHPSRTDAEYPLKMPKECKNCDSQSAKHGTPDDKSNLLAGGPVSRSISSGFVVPLR